MNLDVCIYSDDEIFAHMLACELCLRGFSTAVSGPCGKGDTAPCRLVIYDADSEPMPRTHGGTPAIGFTKDFDGIKGGLLVRPFRVSELISLVQSRLETTKAVVEEGNPLKSYPREDAVILSDTEKTVTIKGAPLTLSPREYLLFKHLFENAGTPVSRGELARAVWGREDNETNVVDVYIYYLREKLEELVGDKMIRTVRNKGYVLNKAAKNKV